MQITGIILSGGQSTRMGTDKALIRIEGKTLLERAIEICKPHCSSVLISSNNAEHKTPGHQIIHDETVNCGPIGGIYSCLMKSETDWNFVISVDAVFVEPVFIDFLFSKTGDYDAVIPFHAKGKEPLIALYHKNCLGELKKMINLENYKMHNLLNVIHTNLLDSRNWVEKYPHLFQNLNHPEDLNLNIDVNS